MAKSVFKVLILAAFIVACTAISAKSYSDSNEDSFEEEKSFNELESLKCLPSGFPCTPIVHHSSIKYTSIKTNEEEEEFPTTESTTVVTDNGGNTTETEEILSTTTMIPSTVTPSKFRSFPSCCSKCLFQEGWIDAVCA